MYFSATGGPLLRRLLDEEAAHLERLAVTIDVGVGLRRTAGVMGGDGEAAGAQPRAACPEDRHAAA
ncbi:MAG TPA: hypothetical protein VGK67_20255 [Myxococcales bacterium]|jgi:hypothetical protein